MNVFWRIPVFLLLGLSAQPVAAGSWQAQAIYMNAPTEESAPLSVPLAKKWGANIEYGINAQTVQIAKQFASGDERGWSKPVFATIQRRFTRDNTTTYFGVGAGYAEGLVTTPSDVVEDALAFKGVFGTEMVLEEGLGAFFEYSYSVAPGANPTSAGSLRSHGLTTGLKLDLN